MHPERVRLDQLAREVEVVSDEAVPHRPVRRASRRARLDDERAVRDVVPRVEHVPPDRVELVCLATTAMSVPVSPPVEPTALTTEASAT